MKRSYLVASLTGIILAAVVAMALTVGFGRSPLLGIDLRGGAEVVLVPSGKVTDTQLNEAVSIVDRRINGLGVANSSVNRQGNDVVIELPGAKNTKSILTAVGTTAQLFFRPVYCTIPAYKAAGATNTKKPTTPPTTSNSSTTVPSKIKSPSTTAKSSVGEKAAAPKLDSALFEAGSSTSSSTLKKTSSTSSANSSTTTTKGSTSTTTVPSKASNTPSSSAVAAALGNKICSAADSQNIPTTSADSDNAGQLVIIPSSKTAGYSGAEASLRWVLGPADFSGRAIKSANASTASSTSSELVVNLTLTSEGQVQFNKMAAERYPAYESSPNSYAALEAFDLDGKLQSAPRITESVFTGGVQITGDFTTTQATDLATVLKYGSLPVKFNISNINTVSATLGHNSLEAGLLAGLGGLILVLIYMIAYYRALGLVVLLGLGVGGGLLYAILTELSYAKGLALTLAGVTGIIVSIGITVDSYIVYFERLKDEVRSGRSIRTSVERGFTRAFKTVLTADLVSFMAALVLYIFTVGDVRGFAFTLGLSTLLDVFTAYFFIRPIVILLGRRRTTSETGFIGMARGLGADEQK